MKGGREGSILTLL